MINIKVNRAYYIQAEAPAGYLFTGGVCNDSVPGWRCPRPSRKSKQEANVETLSKERVSFGEKFATNGGEDALGLRTGRSLRCVSVDRTGKVDGILDLGVMKVGDVQLDKTEVRMSLDLGDLEHSDFALVGEGLTNKYQNQEGSSGSSSSSSSEGKRSLLQSLMSKFSRQSISTPTSFQERLLRQATPLSNNRYLLNDDDEYSIGVIAAEVLASSLDVALAANYIELDHISPKEVILSLAPTYKEDKNTATTSSTHNKGNNLRNRNNSTANTQNYVANQRNPTPRRQNRLTIDLEVWGHYPPQLNVDFDYIVQDSINRETEVIREELKEYNENCDDQNAKVDDHGFVLDDFEEIHSNKGVASNTKLKRERNAQAEDMMEELDQEEYVEGGVFRTACSNNVKLPEYFEKSLESIEVTKVVVEPAVILEEPTETPIVAISLMATLFVIMLIGGFFVFRLGFKKRPRDLDPYQDGYSIDEEDTEYGSRSKGEFSVCTKPQEKPEACDDTKASLSKVDENGAPPMNLFGNLTKKLSLGLARRNSISGASCTSDKQHSAFARHNSAPDADGTSILDGSESIPDPTKALNEDHIDASERIKDFERRMKSMKESKIILDNSFASSRPTVPDNIKFAAQFETKNTDGTGKGSISSSSGDSSSDSSTSAPVKERSRRKKTAGDKKKQKKKSHSDNKTKKKKSASSPRQGEGKPRRKSLS